MWSNGSVTRKNREAWLDIAKFFGIVFVVLNHVDVQIPVITFFGGMFYMPVFFVAAGYTYRNKGEGLKAYALGKAKRLLVPYILCNLFLVGFFIVRTGIISKPSLLGIFYSRTMLMAADCSWNMALMPNLNAPTWFLTCLFLCLCIYYALDCTWKEAKKRRIAVGIAMATGILMRTVSPILLPWSVENALYFLGLIELGRFLKEGGLTWLRKNEWIYANFFIVFGVLSYVNGSVNVSISLYGRSMIMYFVVGALGSLLCMKAAELTEKYLKVFAKPFGWIGQHTMAILCWHLFVIEIVKTLLRIL